MYCYNIIDKIRSQADIRKYLPKKMKCEKCGGNLTTSKKYQMYYCPNCQPEGSAGIVLTILTEKQKMGFTEAIEYLAEKEEIQLQECIYSEDEYSIEKCEKCNLFKN